MSERKVKMFHADVDGHVNGLMVDGDVNGVKIGGNYIKAMGRRMVFWEDDGWTIEPVIELPTAVGTVIEADVTRGEATVRTRLILISDEHRAPWLSVRAVNGCYYHTSEHIDASTAVVLLEGEEPS